MTLASVSTTAPEPRHPTALFGLGSIALAGLVGGPLASGYLVARNLAALRTPRLQAVAIGFHAVAVTFWLWSLYHVPRDALSELVVHIPQWLVWCVVSAVLLRRQHLQFAAAGGKFRSAWIGFGVGVLVSVALRLVLRVALPALA